MDPHHLLAENDGEIDLQFLEYDTCFSRFASSIRQLFIPTSLKLALEAQQKLFSTFVASPVQHRRYVLENGECLNYIDICGTGEEYRESKKNGVSTMSGGVNNSGSDFDDQCKQRLTLLLMHGYGSGLAMFFDNYDNFAQQFSRVVAVDWRGMGASSRGSRTPHPSSHCCCCSCCCLPCTPCDCGAQYDITPAVDFFIDCLHELVEGLGLSDIVLAGHSLGGYLSSRYVMKFHRSNGINPITGVMSPIKGVILFSPAGLEPVPNDDNIIPSSLLPLKPSLALRLLSSNYTPQGVIRAFCCFGKERVHLLVARRFGSDRWSTAEAECIANYLYHISAQRRAGEDALNALLQLMFVRTEAGTMPKCLARKPVTPSDLSILAPSSSSSPRDSDKDFSACSGVPLLLLYGDSDWLHFPTAKTFAQELKKHGVAASFKLIRSAGHHLYMDNAGHFHSVIGDWLQDNFSLPDSI